MADRQSQSQNQSQNNSLWDGGRHGCRYRVQSQNQNPRIRSHRMFPAAADLVIQSGSQNLKNRLRLIHRRMSSPTSQ